MPSSPAPRRPDRLDEWLRHLLAPAPEAVQRTVHRALNDLPDAASRPGARRIPAPAWAASLALLVVAGIALLLAWRTGRLPAAPADRPAAISIVNEGEVLIVTSPAGDRLVRAAEPPSTGLIVISHGGGEE